MSNIFFVSIGNSNDAASGENVVAFDGKALVEKAYVLFNFFELSSWCKKDIKWWLDKDEDDEVNDHGDNIEDDKNVKDDEYYKFNDKTKDMTEKCKATFRLINFELR